MAQPIYVYLNSFSQGFCAGYTEEEAPDTSLLNSTPVDVAFSPTASTLFQPIDSIQFKSGEKMPVILSRAIVMVPDESYPQWSVWAGFTLNVLIALGFVMLLIELIKFIIAINKGKYFEKRNVKHLLRFGQCLIAIAVFQLAVGIMDDTIFSNIGIRYPGYELTTYWILPTTNILLGLMALMMSQIWQRAIQLKEDQELTI